MIGSRHRIPAGLGLTEIGLPCMTLVLPAFCCSAPNPARPVPSVANSGNRGWNRVVLAGALAQPRVHRSGSGCPVLELGHWPVAGVKQGRGGRQPVRADDKARSVPT
jgi:hypothetical protein